MSDWGALNARARGLGARLPSHARLAALADIREPTALAAALAGMGVPVAAEETRRDALELAVRRRAGDALATLARWSPEVPGAASVLFEEEDRRSVRALVRGATAGSAAESRLAGLVPTPRLPVRALEELARQADAAAVAALLSVWGSQYGRALLPLAAGARPDLFALELEVNRTWAAGLRAGARRGGRGLRRHVARMIDVENAAAALTLAARREEPESEGLFLEGGALLDVASFSVALSAGVAEGPRWAARRLAAKLGGAVAAALLRHALDPAGLEVALLAARIKELRTQARVDPLGPWTVLLFGLRLRAHVLDVRRLIWGGALGAPASALAERLASA